MSGPEAGWRPVRDRQATAYPDVAHAVSKIARCGPSGGLSRGSEVEDRDVSACALNERTSIRNAESLSWGECGLVDRLGEAQQIGVDNVTL